MNLRKPAAALAAATCSAALAATTLVTPAGAVPTAAERAARPVSVLVNGLIGPRQISPYGSRMYVAESDTGQVSYVSPKTGGMKAVVKGLATPQGVVRVKDKLYIAVGEASPDSAPTATAAAIMVSEVPGQGRVYVLNGKTGKPDPHHQGPDGTNGCRRLEEGNCVHLAGHRGCAPGPAPGFLGQQNAGQIVHVRQSAFTKK